MRTSKIIIKSLFGISEQEIGSKSIELTGRKGAGKTSVLDAIRYALTNSSNRDWVIKNGESEGRNYCRKPIPDLLLTVKPAAIKQILYRLRKTVQR